MSRGTLRVRGPWGPFSKIMIEGGPWNSKPHNAFGICMAPEVVGDIYQKVFQEKTPEVMVNVRDFSTPDPDEVRLAALLGLQCALTSKRQVYVGCGFGIGRTGTMLGLMARIANPRLGDPVGYVRDHYYRDAIETTAQEGMVETLNVSVAQKLYQKWLWQRRLGSPHSYVIPMEAWKVGPHSTT